MRAAMGNIATYVLSFWFVAVFVLITLSGVGFLGTLLYQVIF